MSAKEILLELAEKLPPDATLNDAISELEFRQSVQQGLDELERGQGVPIETVKARIAKRAGKRSSLRLRTRTSLRTAGGFLVRDSTALRGRLLKQGACEPI